MGLSAAHVCPLLDQSERGPHRLAEKRATAADQMFQAGYSKFTIVVAIYFQNKAIAPAKTAAKIKTESPILTTSSRASTRAWAANISKSLEGASPSLRASSAARSRACSRSKIFIESWSWHIS